MEVEEIQTQQPCKFSRISNGRNDTTKSYPDEEEDHDLKRPNQSSGAGSINASDGAASNRLRGWHHSSRIIRVSRASGGKDRHSKVWTSKGPRDRRVRLSVNTAIQFYDLQDRLGYDQPSKAVEWLIKAAADAISELPSLNSSFPNTPKQLSDEKRGSDGGTEQGFDSAEVELEDPSFNNQSNNQHLSLSKSACSSTSETSKGSGLSLSRSDVRVNRVRARERARERAAKEKEKENDSHIAHHHHQSVNPISQNSTFTELLTGGISSVSNNSNNNNNNAATTTTTSGSVANFFQKPAAASRQWPLPPMDYFSTGLLQPSSSRTTHQSSGYSGGIQLGNSIQQAMTMSMSINPPFNENHHQEQQLQQHFPFVSDHLMPVATTTTQPGPGGDYNLNFTISSGALAAGFNRGTLQSNSSSISPHSLLPHLQRFTPSPIDGSTNVPFFIGAAASASTPPMENHHHHHHHHHQFPSGLQLCYGDANRHSDKGKGKN